MNVETLAKKLDQMVKDGRGDVEIVVGEAQKRLFGFEDHEEIARLILVDEAKF